MNLEVKLNWEDPQWSLQKCEGSIQEGAQKHTQVVYGNWDGLLSLNSSHSTALKKVEYIYIYGCLKWAGLLFVLIYTYMCWSGWRCLGREKININGYFDGDGWWDELLYINSVGSAGDEVFSHLWRRELACGDYDNGCYFVFYSNKKTMMNEIMYMYFLIHRPAQGKWWWVWASLPPTSHSFSSPFFSSFLFSCAKYIQFFSSIFFLSFFFLFIVRCVRNIY